MAQKSIPVPNYIFIGDLQVIIGFSTAQNKVLVVGRYAIQEALRYWNFKEIK